MTISNYASSLGQKIGRTFENAVFRYLEPGISGIGYGIRSEKIINGDGDQYNIDLVLRNRDGNIVSLMETKFIRYTKHNRDKGSWIANTHNTLRDHYTTIDNCYAILGGNWSAPSVDMMRRKHVNVIRIPFEHIANVYLDYGVNIRWEERDDIAKEAAFNAENRLTNTQRQIIGDKVISNILIDLNQIINNCIRLGF